MIRYTYVLKAVIELSYSKITRNLIKVASREFYPLHNAISM